MSRKGPARIYNLISLVFLLLSLGVVIYVVLQLVS